MELYQTRVRGLEEMGFWHFGDASPQMPFLVPVGEVGHSVGGFSCSGFSGMGLMSHVSKRIVPRWQVGSEGDDDGLIFGEIRLR